MGFLLRDSNYCEVTHKILNGSLLSEGVLKNLQLFNGSRTVEFSFRAKIHLT